MNTVTRRDLNQKELGLLVTFIVASGAWETRGIRRIEAFSALVDVCKTLSLEDDIDRTIDRFALCCQNALMAYRRGSFEAIQGEPPFRNNTIENLKLLAEAWVVGQEATLLERFTSIFADPNSNEHSTPIFEIVSGDAKSMDSPVKFTDSSIENRSRCECWFINYALGYENQDWYRGLHFTTSRRSDGLGISLWEVKLPDGRDWSFYFDTNWI